MRVGMGCPNLSAAAGGLSPGDYRVIPLLERSGFFHFFGTRRLDAGELKSRYALRQVHGDQVVIVSDDGPEAVTGDGLATDRPGVWVTVSTADCVPIILIDPETKAVSALHAGWRGTVLNIAARGVETLKKQYGSRPAALLAGIGPGIGPCCFEVGREVWQTIEQKYTYGHEVIEGHTGEKARVDLARLHRLQLTEAGLIPEQIASIDLCTVCNEAMFYSYRRDKTKGRGMVSGVMRSP